MIIYGYLINTEMPIRKILVTMLLEIFTGVDSNDKSCNDRKITFFKADILQPEN